MRPGLFLQPGIYGTDRQKSRRILDEIKPGSILLLGRDFTDLDSLKDLIKWIFDYYDKELKIQKPLIAIDQEGGNVVRIRDLDYIPSNYALGVLGNETYARYSGMITGQQLAGLNIRWNLAPVLDTYSNPENPIVMERSFGSNPEMVSKLGSSYVDGLQSAGVVATAKHFPGHGYVREDSHLKLPVDTRDMDSIQNSVVPFRNAIRHGVKSIMVSHIKFEAIDPDFPASLSSNVMGFLRKEVKFENVIITDSLDMKAISANFSVDEFTKQAYEGGADILECADPDMSLEMFEKVKEICQNNYEKRTERILRLTNFEANSITPPPEIMSWISAQSIRWIRKKTLDPEKILLIVPLRSRGDNSVWPYKMHEEVSRKLNSIGIKNELRYLDDNLNVKDDSIIFIGKNLHLGNNWKLINELGKNNECCFLSTGIPSDSALLEDSIGFIAAMSEKLESVLAAVYSIFGLYDSKYLENARL